MAKAYATSKKRKKACPKCGSADVVPILYGYPTSKCFADAEKGTIALGGCCVSGDDPRKLCKVCGEEFDRPRARAERTVDPRADATEERG